MPNACHKTKRCQHATIVSNVRWHFLERKTMFNFRPRIPSTLHLRLVNSRMQPVCRNSDDYFDSLQEFCSRLFFSSSSLIPPLAFFTIPPFCTDKIIFLGCFNLPAVVMEAASILAILWGLCLRCFGSELLVLKIELALSLLNFCFSTFAFQL